MKITIELGEWETTCFLHCQRSIRDSGYTDVTDTEVHHATVIGLETWYMENQHRDCPNPRLPRTCAYSGDHD